MRKRPGFLFAAGDCTGSFHLPFFLAILAGFAVDNLGSLAFGLLLGSFLPTYDRTRGPYLESVFTAANQNQVSHPLLLEGLSLGAGGFLACWAALSPAGSLNAAR